jgi:CRP-like cAMP-binding protein
MNINKKMDANSLLATLPVDARERIFPCLDLIPLRAGQVLYERGEKLQYIYFPTTAIISLQYGSADGASSEIAGVGREGMLDISLYTGSETAFAKATVKVAGQGFRIDAALIYAEIKRSAVIMRIFLRYTQALFTQVSLTVVCNRYHSVEQQLCRWILLALDRAPEGGLDLAPSALADMLGARQEIVAEIAESLREAGYLSFLSDHIRVICRAGLEAKVCSCYGLIRSEFKRLLADTQMIEV